MYLNRDKGGAMKKKMALIGKKTGLELKEVNNLTRIGVSGLLTLILSVFTVGESGANAAELKPQPEKDTTVEVCGTFLSI
jgi:hypothetical protein